MTQSMTSADRIPVIDFGRFLTGNASDRTASAKEIGDAAEHVGFLILSNHGIPREITDRAFAVSRGFFDQDVEAKLRVRPEKPTVPRGYQVFGKSRLAKTMGQETPGDLREQFFMGPPSAQSTPLLKRTPEAAPFYAENIWPLAPTDFQAVFSDLYGRLERLGASVMSSFAMALGLPADHFDKMIDQHFSTGTTNNYPEPDGPPLPGQLRCGTHTDFGSLTLLVTSDAPGGLQVARDDGSWLDVKPAPDQIIVNLGDMMARWTNDRWRSTLHRVVNPPDEQSAGSRRQTMGYFLHPNFDAPIDALPGCIDASHPRRYPPILAGRHMREKLVSRVAA